MSIVLSKVAEPYAEALLDLAKSNDSLKETTNDMNIVSQFLANSSDLKKFLGNPLITREAKKNVVKDILGEQIGASTLKFLLLLVDRNRIEVLRQHCSKVFRTYLTSRNLLKLQRLLHQSNYLLINKRNCRKTKSHYRCKAN